MELHRRDLLVKTGAAGLLLMSAATGATALDQSGGEIVAWTDQPDPVPAEIAGGIKSSNSLGGSKHSYYSDQQVLCRKSLQLADSRRSQVAIEGDGASGKASDVDPR